MEKYVSLLLLDNREIIGCLCAGLAVNSEAGNERIDFDINSFEVDVQKIIDEKYYRLRSQSEYYSREVC